MDFSLELCITDKLCCAHCQLVVFTTIHQCAKGHNFCKFCFEDIDFCPKCNSPKGIGRNFAIERLCLKLKFPCQNNHLGCKVAEKFDDLSLHQLFCDFSSRPCPLIFNTSCQWNGTFKDLKNHCEKCHPELIAEIYNSAIEQTAYIDKNPLIHFIIFAYDTAFLCKWNYRIVRSPLYSVTTHLSVTHLGQMSRNKKYSFLIGIGKEDSGVFYKVYQSNCLHPKDDVLGPPCESNAISVPTDLLIMNSCRGKFIFKLDIQEEIIYPAEEYSLETQVLSELECPNCLNVMERPIQQCANGHVFCTACFRWMEDCLECTAPKTFSRNLSLEQIGVLLKRPCIYANLDCDYLGYSTDMVTHAKKCWFRPRSCPLRSISNCNWKGSAKSIMGHYMKNHSDSIPLTSDDVWHIQGFQFGEYPREFCSFCLANGVIFRFTGHFDEATGRALMGCYYFGEPLENGRFHYEISFGAGLKFESVCALIIDDANMFHIPYFIQVKYSQLTKFCDKNGDLICGVNIIDLKETKKVK